MNNFNFRKNNFDLIRLLAALQVVVFHGHEHFGIEEASWIFTLLTIFPGVPIFFVVSGFLISASLERSSSLVSYTKNRILRIYPGLWVCFVISVISIFVLYNPQFGAFEFISWAAAQLTILQFYNPDFLRGYGVGVLNGSLWTIPVEIQFYLILPLLYSVFKKIKWSKYVLLIFFLLLVAINQYYVEQRLDENLLLKLFGASVLPYLYIFLFGVFLQRNISIVSKYLQNNAHYFLIAYLLSIFISNQIGATYQGNYINPVSAIILSLFTISIAYSYVEKFFGILKGNDISYGVYIYHMIFVNALIELAIFTKWINLVVMITATIITAFISWKIIEKPSLALKDYTIKRQKIL